jgi:hypothetical protein
MLTIKTKETREVEKTIPLPYYCKSGNTYYKVSTDEWVTRLFAPSSDTRNKLDLVSISSAGVAIYMPELSKGEEITYLEFEIALNKTLDFLKETALSEGALKEAI